MVRWGRLGWVALLGCAADCSSGSSGGAPHNPLSAWFTDRDCPTRSLVEIARMQQAQRCVPGWASGLSVAGGQLYFAYSVPPAADADGGLAPGQNWLAA